MLSALQNTAPSLLWHYFAAISAIPRASGKEQAVAKYILEFAANAGLKTKQDTVGNVLVLKPGTLGMEYSPPVALQAHLDMVQQQQPYSTFDFENQGLNLVLDEDWVKADCTTLGADNGIGIAAMLAILVSDDLKHPPIEALFTVGEEDGMTGALGLPETLLSAEAMLNLDTEEDDSITIGCAGRVRVIVNGKYKETTVPDKTLSYSLKVSGLTGGHSGLDIHLGRVNANKLLCKLLSSASVHCTFHIGSLNGESLLNAIPREATAVLVVPEMEASVFEKRMHLLANRLCQQFKKTDPDLKIQLTACTPPGSIMLVEEQRSFLHVLNWCPDGVYTMCSDVPEPLVQTSNNLAILQLANGRYLLKWLTRSSMDSEKQQLAQSIKVAFSNLGADVKLEGSYGGWMPNLHSTLVRFVAHTYHKLYGTLPALKAIHAGLECGIISSKYPQMEIVSIGPTIIGAHTPHECVSIKSVEKFWQLITEVLANFTSYYKAANQIPQNVSPDFK